jgi:hypothetical protein
VYLLLNDGKNRAKPVFTSRVLFDMEKTNHGMCAGGGDWDQDGVADFLHMPFAGNSYKQFKGEVVNGAEGKQGRKFAEGGLKAANVLKISGEKAEANAWAWDFSGSARVNGQIEYVGTARNARAIFLYQVTGGVSRKIATLAEHEGDYPQLTVSDLNGDGKMDILYAGGCFKNQKDHTQIFVMYGK